MLNDYFREEVDEETAEWENEQLRRTGVRASSSSPQPAKQVYKPAPSKNLLGLI
jgi:GC-rich sequence DNA-binding factor